MALALIQTGTGTGLVIFWGPAPDAPGLPKGCKAALGSKVSIVGVRADEATSESWQEIMAYAQRKTGIAALWLCALIGFSAGCRDVRKARWAGAPAFGYVLCDGMHAAIAPGADRDAHLAYAKGLVADARAGTIATVITHSYIVTEGGGVGGPTPYLSTRAVAELATGFRLLPEPARGVEQVHREGPPATPARWQGHLAVWSVGGHEAADHIAQANVVLARALEAELADLVQLDAAPASAPLPGPFVPPAPAPSADRSSVALIGDSLAQGLAQGLRSRAEGSGRKFTAWGVQSTTIADWLRGGKGTQLAAALAGAPSLVLVSLGTNDMRAGASAAAAGDLVDRIRRAGADAAWIAPPLMPFEAGAGTWRADLQGALEPTGARTFDSLAMTIPRAGDGIHPTPAGYRAWADAVAAWAPFGAAAAGGALQLPESIYVAGSGWISVEDVYLPRVVTAEIGPTAPLESMRAQAVAARTYLLYAIREQGLGTARKPVPSSESFQVMGKAASARAAQAGADTRAGIACWRGQPITANYVAGSKWDAFLKPADTTGVEERVTYNWKKTGADVKACRVGLRGNPANRGCMSQNGAIWCGKFTRFSYLEILRVFYGADLEIAGLAPGAPLPAPSPAPAPSPPSPSPPPSVSSSPSSGAPIALAAGIALVRLLFSSSSS